MWKDEKKLWLVPKALWCPVTLVSRWALEHLYEATSIVFDMIDIVDLSLLRMYSCILDLARLTMKTNCMHKNGQSTTCLLRLQYWGIYEVEPESGRVNCETAFLDLWHVNMWLRER